MYLVRTQFVTFLFEKHGRELKNFLGTMMRSREDIEDLMQETFLRLASMERPETIRSPKAYVFSLAHNLVVDHYRKNKASTIDRSVALDDCEETAVQPPAERGMDARRDLDMLQAAIMELPEKTQKIFILRKFHDRSYADLARDFNMSEQAIRQHVSRGLKECMTYMQSKKEERGNTNS